MLLHLFQTEQKGSILFQQETCSFSISNFFVVPRTDEQNEQR